MSPELNRLKGKINKWFGVTTGDREQEATGVAQEVLGQDPTPAQKRKATRAVKNAHHDYGERVPPQRVPHEARITPAPASRAAVRAARAR